jgi:deoxycytidylate deaminase
MERRFRDLMGNLHRWAESMACGCKRKQVGFALVAIGPDGHFREICRAHNGPSAAGHECSNVVGGCGCGHSEPRLMMAAMRAGYTAPQWIDKLVVVGTYSPCSFCANAIVDAKIAHVCVYDILTEHDTRGVEILNRGLPKGAVSIADLKYEEIESWA